MPSLLSLLLGNMDGKSTGKACDRQERLAEQRVRVGLRDSRGWKCRSESSLRPCPVLDLVKDGMMPEMRSLSRSGQGQPGSVYLTKADVLHRSYGSPGRLLFPGAFLGF